MPSDTTDPTSRVGLVIIDDAAHMPRERLRHLVEAHLSTSHEGAVIVDVRDGHVRLRDIEVERIQELERVVLRPRQILPELEIMPMQVATFYDARPTHFTPSKHGSKKTHKRNQRKR